MSTHQGILIVFDGIDGAGKTTQVKLLERALADVGESVITSKEPTDGTWGMKLRRSALEGRMPFDEELAAFIADRQEHLSTKILPALADGKIVILDRYFYSTIAYQGIQVDDYRTIEAAVRADVLQPDVAFWLDAPVDLSLSRVRARDGRENEFEKQEDLCRAAEIFKQLADSDSLISRVDATEPQELVYASIIRTLVRGALKAKRCLKEYDCDDAYYCTPRQDGSCPWWLMASKLLGETQIVRQVPTPH